MPPVIGIPTMSFSQKCHDGPPAHHYVHLPLIARLRHSDRKRTNSHGSGSGTQWMSRDSIPSVEPLLDMAHDALPNRLPELDRNGVADQSSDLLAMDGGDLRQELIGLREALEARPFAQ